MYGVHRAIFVGVLTGILLLIGLTSLIASPQLVVQASTAGLPGEAALEPAAEPNTEGAADPALEVPSAETTPPDEAPQEETRPETNDCAVSGSYPDSIRQWCNLIQTFASQHGLEPNLVAAVMLQESGGNAQAYSRSGAVGLMQVMPRDGLAASFMCVNGPCFASRPSSSELFDPEYNISYGTRMLAGLIQKRGSVRDGLMAYGPANVGYSYADKVLAIYDSRR